ncbi:MAG TPA: cytochrome ubiquinol oxidase subunit I [Rickettsiales bacterium]|nr:cytochrome ubiquinol oxidase subunit I [Rickettsiales bacterium]
MDPIVLSRLQFAATALYHFLFVPLTLGLCWLLVILEATYIMTGKTIWRDATQFWGKLFGINFAMGVATGITMEFQFGTNWAYYSHYVGDIFGTPLAIEGLMAFFLESTFVGLFFFGWKKMSKVQHLFATFCLAFGTNLSAVWILIANGWMQNPVGAYFNPDTMRMEMRSFYDLIFNPVAQAKFVHTVSAGYVCGSTFMLAISAYFLLRGQHMEIMKRSFAVAASFGLASALCVVVLGDESGYTVNENQKMKMAAIEAMWETEPAPASFTLFAIPDQEHMRNDYQITIPWIMGLIGTRTFNEKISGMKEIVAESEQRIASGIEAYKALGAVKADPKNKDQRNILSAHAEDLGYGLLLKAKGIEPAKATPEQIHTAALSLIPRVTPLFWSFRIMVLCGVWFILLYVLAFRASVLRRFDNPMLLKAALYSLPLPWIAIELGWIVAEYGRQPWAIQGVLPTGLGVSATSTELVLTSLLGFVIFYSSLLVVDIYLMLKYAKKGPSLSPESLAQITV